MTVEFATAIAEAYQVEGAVVDIGRGVHDGKLAAEVVVQIPLRMMNDIADLMRTTPDGRGVISCLELPAAAAAEPEGEPAAPPPPRPPKEPGGMADFLKSREGKALQRQVVRSVFGMLRKRL